MFWVMADRHSGYLVTLAEDVREDDTALAAAIAQLKGVLQVVPVPADLRQHIANERARSELRSALSAVLWPPR